MVSYRGRLRALPGLDRSAPTRRCPLRRLESRVVGTSYLKSPIVVVGARLQRAHAASEPDFSLIPRWTRVAPGRWTTSRCATSRRSFTSSSSRAVSSTPSRFAAQSVRRERGLRIGGRGRTDSGAAGQLEAPINACTFALLWIDNRSAGEAADSTHASIRQQRPKDVAPPSPVPHCPSPCPTHVDAPALPAAVPPVPARRRRAPCR